jgi:hypothetical protein
MRHMCRFLISKPMYTCCVLLLLRHVTCITILTFFSGEGPRSRRYGRAAAMRFIVRPYEDEDDDDYYFLSFS